MNAVGRADIDTKKILDARVGDHIGHDEVFLNLKFGVLRPLLNARVLENEDPRR
jgi:hypothetical protein